MKTPRFAVLALGVATVATFATAGCKSDAEKPATTAPTAVATSAAPQPTAVEALVAATTKLSEQTNTFTMSMSGLASVQGSGSMDRPNRKMSATMDISTAGQAISTIVIRIGDDVWVRYSGLPGLPKQWMHVDVNKLTATSALRSSLDDPSGAVNMVNGLVEVQRDGETGYRGVIDATKSPTANAAVKQLGDKAKAVPFTAKQDAQGRLIEMKISMSALQAQLGDMNVTYGDFGSAVAISAPPAGDVIEAPAKLLAAL